MIFSGLLSLLLRLTRVPEDKGEGLSEAGDDVVRAGEDFPFTSG